MNITEIITRPLVTEKSTKLAESKVFLFQVHKAANKHQIAETVEELFDVKVDHVRISIRKGKEKRVGRRMTPKAMPNIKIAYVRLAEGSIDLFPQA